MHCYVTVEYLAKMYAMIHARKFLQRLCHLTKTEFKICAEWLKKILHIIMTRLLQKNNSTMFPLGISHDISREGILLLAESKDMHSILVRITP